MKTKIIMPQLGESVVDGTVGEWLKQVGDTVTEFEPIVRVSTDKVDTEIPAPANGVLLAIHIVEGETVNAGVVLGLIGDANEADGVDDDATPHNGHARPASQPAKPGSQPAKPGSQSARPASQPAQSPSSTLPLRPMPEATASYTGHVTPVVARMITEHNLDITKIPGTGRDGRVTKRDVLDYLESQRTAAQVQAELDELPPWEQPGTGDLFKPTVEYSAEVVARPTTMMTRPPGLDFSKRNAPLPAQPERTHETLPSIPSITPVASNIPGELLALTTMRRAIAQHMVYSEHTAPHVTTIFEVDLSAVMAHRDAHKEALGRQGVNLTYTAYFVAACAAALREHPTVNSRWTDEGIYVYSLINIGMATALDDGLIVPVVRNAGDYALPGLARLVNDLAERARAKQLKPDEVRDGTFTITNHGISGSLFATPIINQPQTAILGVGAIEKRVKVIHDMIAIRPCAYLSLTFDHRVLDGVKADAFVTTIKQTLEQWA